MVPDIMITAIPIIIFEAGLGSYSPEEGVISRLMKSLITLIFILSIYGVL